LPASADAELEELYRRAAWLGSQGREPLVSFTSLFLAFLGGGTPIADWVKATAEHMKLEPQVILDAWAQSPISSRRMIYPRDLRIEHVLVPQAPAVRRDDVTPSVRAVLDAAEAHRAATGGSRLGARHVFAVYVFGPVGDSHEAESWLFRRRSWAARFAIALARITPEEAERWRSIAGAGWSAPPSERMCHILRVAEALARRRQATVFEVEDLVRALLHGAATRPEEHTWNRWLLEQLPRSALEVLQVPTSAVDLAAADGRVSSKLEMLRSSDAQAWLRDAQIWALCCPSDGTHIRHVVAALVAPRGPAAARRMLRAVGCDPTQLARLLADGIRREPHEDQSTWQWLVDNDVAHAEQPRPGYASDVARGADLLSLGSEVRALASVLASRDTRPPLSVGLFGNWGSGKSFFMEMLREHIRTLADRSCGSQGSSYCSEVAQIEFNAWHYLDGDLWASLVSHVLDSLETYFRGDARSVAERARLELTTNQLQVADIDKQERDLEKRRKRFEDDVTAYDPSGAEVAKVLGSEVAEVVKQRTAETHPDVRKALDDVARRIGVAPGELSLNAVRDHALAIRAWWKQVTTARLAIGGAVLLIAVVGIVVTRSYAGAVLWATTAITPALVMIGQVLHVIVPISRAARRASETGQRITDRIARTRPSAFRERKEIEDKQAELADQRRQLEQRAEELRKTLLATRAPGMREYVLNRAGEYRDRLGIVASVHRDFRNLSDRLGDDTSDPKLQRIILYIDDLDRCPPPRVVEMLQAIHLLLSFELFVVVVAVDPTWLTRSLEAYYARQFAGCVSSSNDREARPQFYLEKIFQIPYALRPMNSQRFGDMVDALLHTAVAPQPPPHDPTPVMDEPSPNHKPVAARTSSSPPVSTALPAPPIDLMPRNLQITGPELTHLRTLGPLVSSPRATKRLTNLYRIVRAGLSGDTLDDFVDDGYQLTQVVLAAVVGCPDVAAEWFRHILPMASGDTAALIAPLEQLSRDSPQARFLLDRVRGSLCSGVATWQRAIDVCRLAARYSFETGALLDLVPT
jgi:hypothetical protein